MTASPLPFWDHRYEENLADGGGLANPYLFNGQWPSTQWVSFSGRGSSVHGEGLGISSQSGPARVENQTIGWDLHLHKSQGKL